MAVRVFVTGGTFDKEYDMLTGNLYFRDTHIKEILDLGRSLVDVRISTLMMVDSLDMTDEDRALILANCKRASEEMILITHGTDSMEITAKLLGEAKIDKTIVLTGAMIPYKFGSSDGLFNLGSSLGFVQSLPHGVYISMNGMYFNWDNVTKNRRLGIFETLK
ncbi:MAG: asparaginase [Bacteroidetes bacterium]|nr:asparaginase [Bacteroidota bacterium]